MAWSIGLPMGVSFNLLLLTGTMDRFWGLLFQAAQILIFAWPVSVPLAAWLCVAYRNASIVGPLENRQLFWLVPLIEIPISMLVWGAVFAHSHGREYFQWQLTVVHGAFLATIAFSLVAVVANRGRRLFVSAVVLLLLLFGLSCCFTAGCSITVDWL